MKKYLFLLLTVTCEVCFAQSTLITPGVNEPNIIASSVQNGGIVPPRMTSIQIQQIVSPIAGTLVYDTTINCLRMYDGTKWECQTKSEDIFTVTGYNQYCTGDDQGNDIIAKGEFVYVVGQFTGSISFITFPSTTFVSMGDTDGFVAKFTRTGTCVWAKHIKNTGKAEANTLAVDAAENVYVGGNYVGNLTAESSTITGMGKRDMFLTSYNSAGTNRWIKSIGGIENDSLTSIAVDGLGFLYATGGFQGTVDFEGLGVFPQTSNGNYDFFLTKYYTSTGDNLGFKVAGAIEYDIGNDIFIDNTNLVYVCGNTLNVNINLESFSITNSISFGIKISTTFNVLSLWPPDMVFTKNILTDPFGNIYFHSPLHLFGSLGYAEIIAPTIIKYNNIFSLNWKYFSNTLASTGIFTNYQIPKLKNGFSIDSYGNIYICGTFSNYILFGQDPVTIENSKESIIKKLSLGASDMFILKLNANGEIVKIYAQGGTLNDVSTALSVNEYGEIYTTGYFSTTQNFGNVNVVNNGGKDFFVMKLVE